MSVFPSRPLEASFRESQGRLHGMCRIEISPRKLEQKMLLDIGRGTPSSIINQSNQSRWADSVTRESDLSQIAVKSSERPINSVPQPMAGNIFRSSFLGEVPGELFSRRQAHRRGVLTRGPECLHTFSLRA